MFGEPCGGDGDANTAKNVTTTPMDLDDKVDSENAGGPSCTVINRYKQNVVIG